MKKIVITAGIIIGIILILALLGVIDLRAAAASLTMIIVGGGGAIVVPSKKELQDQQDQIKKDGQQTIQDIKDRPADEDIKTLSPDTKTSIDDVRSTTVQNIMKRIKKNG